MSFWETFKEAWSRHENAPRTVCPDCQHEISEGYEHHCPPKAKDPGEPGS